MGKASAPLLLGCQAPTVQAPVHLSLRTFQAQGTGLQEEGCTKLTGQVHGTWVLWAVLKDWGRAGGLTPLSGQPVAARCPCAEQGHSNCTLGTVGTGIGWKWLGSRGQMTLDRCGWYLQGRAAAQHTRSHLGSQGILSVRALVGAVQMQHWQWLWPTEHTLSSHLCCRLLAASQVHCLPGTMTMACTKRISGIFF